MKDISANHFADAVALDATDTVATALRDLIAGETVRLRLGDALRNATIGEAIAFGHKFALTDIPKDVPVVKYGCTIGHSTCAISSGAHVHVHNLTSARARKAQD